MEMKSIELNEVQWKLVLSWYAKCFNHLLTDEIDDELAKIIESKLELHNP